MYSEYNVGNDYREFARNKDVDESKIKVTLLNGVLELELPKRSRRGPGKEKFAAPDRLLDRTALRSSQSWQVLDWEAGGYPELPRNQFATGGSLILWPSGGMG